MRLDDRRAGEMDGERVHRLPTLPNLEMKVRPGRKAARTHIADQLPAPNEAPRFGDHLAHVAVEAGEPAAVGDLHFAAVAAAPAGADHVPVSGGHDRRSPT